MKTIKQDSVIAISNPNTEKLEEGCTWSDLEIGSGYMNFLPCKKCGAIHRGSAMSPRRVHYKIPERSDCVECGGCSKHIDTRTSAIEITIGIEGKDQKQFQFYACSYECRDKMLAELRQLGIKRQHP